PIEDRLYVAETGGARLWQFNIKAPGEIAPLPFPSPNGGVMLYGGGSTYQRFDSLAVDNAGNVCVATLINGGITVVAPDGRLVEQIALPDVFTTNICFGGRDLQTAYVTLSSRGECVRLRWPRPGLPLNFLQK